MPTGDATTQMTRLTWYMDTETWSHWARGRGATTIQQEVMNGIHAVSGDSDHAKGLRKHTRKMAHCSTRLRSTLLTNDARLKRTHKISVDVPAKEWGEAIALASEAGVSPSPKDFVAAIILNSESWNQEGIETAEDDAGWYHDSIITALDDLRQEDLSLGLQPASGMHNPNSDFDSMDGLRRIALRRAGTNNHPNQHGELDIMSALNALLQDKVRVHKLDGTHSGELRANVSRNLIVVNRADVPIEEGDTIERQTSYGVTERYVVEEAEFYEKFHGIPAHYQLHVRKQTKLPKPKHDSGPSDSGIHVHGDHNRVLVHSIDESINVMDEHPVTHTLDLLTQEIEKGVEDEQERDDAKEVLQLVKELVEQNRARPGVVEKLLKSIPVVGKVALLTDKLVSGLKAMSDCG